MESVTRPVTLADAFWVNEGVEAAAARQAMTARRWRTMVSRYPTGMWRAGVGLASFLDVFLLLLGRPKAFCVFSMRCLGSFVHFS